MWLFWSLVLNYLLYNLKHYYPHNKQFLGELKNLNHRPLSWNHDHFPGLLSWSRPKLPVIETSSSPATTHSVCKVTKHSPLQRVILYISKHFLNLLKGLNCSLVSFPRKKTHHNITCLNNSQRRLPQKRGQGQVELCYGKVSDTFQSEHIEIFRRRGFIETSGLLHEASLNSEFQSRFRVDKSR